MERLLMDIRHEYDYMKLSFKECGSAYFSWYKHIFPTAIIEKPEERDMLIRFVKENAQLNKYPIILKNRIPKWNILWLKAPIATKKYLPVRLHPIYRGEKTQDELSLNHFIKRYHDGKVMEKQEAVTLLSTYIKKQGITVNNLKRFYRQFFVTGHYNEQMRWRFANVLTVVEVDDNLVEAISLANNYSRDNETLFAEIKEQVSNHRQTYTRLEEIFYSNGDISKKIKKDPLVKRLSGDLIGMRKELSHLESKIKSRTGMETIRKDQSLFIVCQTKESVTPLRIISYDEFRDLKSVTLDTEIPGFAGPHPEMSFIGQINKSPQSLEKKIYTIRKTGHTTVNGYSILEEDTTTEMMKKVGDEWVDKDVILLFNAVFDCIMMREEDDSFSKVRKTDLGMVDIRPRKEVTIKFFERIGIKEKVVIDNLRKAQIIDDYLVNSKLELVGRHHTGTFDKSISYEEQATLDEIVRNDPNPKKRAKASWPILNYLGGDVDITYAVSESEPFLRFDKDALELSQSFGVPFMWLCYSVKSINNAQKMSYFFNVGTYRESVFMLNKKMIDLRKKAVNRINDIIERDYKTTSILGVYHNVWQYYIPYGHALKDLIEKRFKPAKKLFDRESKTNFQRHYLARFENALAEYIMIDYALYDLMLERFKKKVEPLIIKKPKLEPWESSDSIDKITDEFAAVYTDARKRAIWLKNNDSRWKMMSTFGRESLALETKKVREFCDKRGVDKEFLMKLKHSYQDVVNMQRRMEGNYSVHPIEVKNALSMKSMQIQALFKENKMKLIHQKGPYLYVSGHPPNDDLNFVNKIGPAIIVEDIKRYPPWNRRIFYEQHGYFKNIPLKGPTNFWTKFEIDNYGEFLNNLCHGNYQDALWTLYYASDAMMSKRVSPHELVWLNSSKNRYFAWQDGQKIHFRTKPSELELKIENGVRFHEEIIGRKKVNGRWQDKIEKVSIIGFDDFIPDWGKYIERHENFIKQCLFPILGEKKTMRFLQSIQDGGIIYERELRKMATKLEPITEQLLLFDCNKSNKKSENKKKIKVKKDNQQGHLF